MCSITSIALRLTVTSEFCPGALLIWKCLEVLVHDIMTELTTSWKRLNIDRYIQVVQLKGDWPEMVVSGSGSTVIAGRPLVDLLQHGPDGTGLLDPGSS
jgi:hypothetical protein